MTDTRMRVGVLASGGGSNLQSIIDRSEDGSLAAIVSVVISNNSTAQALERARRHGIPAYHVSAFTEGSETDSDERITALMLEHGVELVALAGYMKRIGPVLMAAFPERIVNIHPALLPRFGGPGMYGIHVHQAVIAANERESGVTVHLVDEHYDHGRILAQSTVPVLPGDTPETLQKRVLVQEHDLYPRVINTIATGRTHGTDMGQAH